MRPANIALSPVMVSGQHGPDQVSCYQNQLFSICANKQNTQMRREKIFTNTDRPLGFGLQPPLLASFLARF
jgi:hypothetical protein